MSYSSLQSIFARIITAGRHAVLIKWDIKDAFRNIPIAPHIQWLLGFNWNRVYYHETCLPFGLSTAPFIFNLFVETFHWILESYPHFPIDHYLDDFTATITAIEATPRLLAQYNRQYKEVTDVLGVPRRESKNETGTVIPVFGIQIDTNLFRASLPADKIHKAISVTASALLKTSLTLKEAQSLTGYLSFCAAVVRLGWVFMRPLWSYVAQFPAAGQQRRFPTQVRLDLTWWNILLPRFNGVLFFNKLRDTFQLYTDASLQGLGGFFFHDSTKSWQEVRINQSEAFLART